MEKAIEKLRHYLENELIKVKESASKNKHFFQQVELFGDRKNECFFDSLDVLAKPLVLEKSLSNYCGKIIMQLTIIKHFFDIINIDELEKPFFLFHFGEISNYLESVTPLDTFEQLQILMFCVEHNITTGLLDDKKDISTISLLPLIMIPYEKICQMIGITVLQKNTENLSKIERTLEYRSIADMKTLQETHETIRTCYFMKKDCYGFEDVNQMIDAFIQLKISPNICKQFKKYLISEINKRNKMMRDSNLQPNKTTATKSNSASKSCITIKSSNLLSREAYTTKLQAIKKIYREESKEILNFVTEEQKIEIASFMIELGYDKKRIQKFLKLAEQSQHCFHLNNEQIPIESATTKFLKLYDKLDYYIKRNHGLIELQQLRDDAITCLYATYECMEKDYNDWYYEFENIVFSIQMQILSPASTYEYEYEKALNFVKQKN